MLEENGYYIGVKLTGDLHFDIVREQCFKV